MVPNTDKNEAANLKLPVGVVGAGDLRKLSRELKQLEETLQQMRLRSSMTVAKLPRASRALEEFASTNRLNLLLPEDRQRASLFITTMLKSAPLLHMSFAAEASRAFTTKIVLWLRTNIHPNILLEVGLEPTIAAGCILRTPNKQYDLSLRDRFTKQAGLLAQKLRSEQEIAAAEPVVKEAPADVG